jgi:biopolymer transport protein ExbD
MVSAPVAEPPEPEAPDAQPLVLPRRRVLGDAEMDITPMIDIVFLLLIFFLVASKMDESATVELPPARHGVDISRENAIVVIIKQERGGKLVVSRRDGQRFADDGELQEQEIGEYVDAGITGSAPFDRPMESIIIMAQGEVKAGEVARVAKVIGRATDTQILNYAVLDSP